jgi:hypothetical protein
MKYNPKVIKAFFASHGIPAPEMEYVFHPVRKWRFDFAWPTLAYPTMVPSEAMDSLALEVQGGIWTKGRHTQGAALLKEWEKLNEAAVLGWRILYCQPQDLISKDTVNSIRRALGIL